uniref:CUB and sushi domain-containing protein 2-like isoform X1 n=1 Tax=Styela clava TaxID=7725 RepID=UPI00193A2AE3|nr:CUB and sushi domain-containing protein 2-like isoform X1 [Styela clava]
MRTTFCIIYVLLMWMVNAEKDDVCGKSIFTSTTGWFTSPLYPLNYPSNQFCEWKIEVNPGHIIEINFADFQIDDRFLAWNETRNDYLVIFENGKDEDGVYFYTPIFDAKYRSKSNRVSIQFISDGDFNFRGFNATYDSWNAIDYCDIASIESGNVTTCEDEIRNNFYKTCYVLCNDGYILKGSSKVKCQNGKFVPEESCGLIDFEVILCDITNMKYCIYTSYELANYFSKKSSRRDMRGDMTLLNKFPDPLVSDSFYQTQQGEALTTEIKVSCFDEEFLGYSYCEIDDDGKFTFQCLDFLHVDDDYLESAAKKMETCYKCREKNCQNMVFIKTIQQRIY